MPLKRRISISVITLFPDFVSHYARFSLIARAIVKNILQWKPVDLRPFGLGVRKVVDDRPYGGGVGMVLRPDVVYKAIQSIRKKVGKKRKVILLTPQGKKLTASLAKELANQDELIFVCGRYEGFDERIRKFVDLEISIGDYILMGGELPALVVSEAILRFVPGVLGKEESAAGESFTESLLEYPQYTRPEVWEVQAVAGKKKLIVPKVLRSGNHQEIAAFRQAESLKRTKKRRPDLLK
jgi:tRNA (guanine37-N1)-methyltransferase